MKYCKTFNIFSFIVVSATSFCMLSLSGISNSSANDKIPSIMILPLEAKGVPEDVAQSLSSLLTLELQQTRMYEPIDQNELKAMLSNTQLKQLLGVDDENELAKIGERVKTDYLLQGSLGKLGSTYVLTLVLIDVKQAKAVRRVKQMLSGKPDGLSGSLNSAVLSLALEERGIAPDITTDLIDNLNIARKSKKLFFKLHSGYQIPIGPGFTNNKDVLAYIIPSLHNDSEGALYYVLPDYLNYKISIEWQLLDWMRILFETGYYLTFSGERLQMENNLGGTILDRLLRNVSIQNCKCIII